MRSLLILSVLFAFNAYAACPQLNGQYAFCTAATGYTPLMQNITISTKIENGEKYTYSLTTNAHTQLSETIQMIPDGEVREYSPQEEVILKTSSQCIDGKLAQYLDYYSDGERVLEMSKIYEIKENIFYIHLLNNNRVVVGTYVCR